MKKFKFDLCFWTTFLVGSGWIMMHTGYEQWSWVPLLPAIFVLSVTCMVLIFLYVMGHLSLNDASDDILQEVFDKRRTSKGSMMHVYEMCLTTALLSTIGINFLAGMLALTIILALLFRIRVDKLMEKQSE